MCMSKLEQIIETVIIITGFLLCGGYIDLSPFFPLRFGSVLVSSSEFGLVCMAMGFILSLSKSQHHHKLYHHKWQTYNKPSTSQDLEETEPEPASLTASNVLTALNCPKCGAPIYFKHGETVTTCTYCRTQTRVNEESA